MQMSCGGVKAILFDCDGTLVDSEYAHYLGWKQALNDLGRDLLLEDYYQYVGKSLKTNAHLIAERLGIRADALLRLKEAHYHNLYRTGVPPISETVRFLHSLATHKESLGLKLGVCSAAKREEVLFHIKCLEIEPLLDVILSGQDDLGDYSDPEGVNKPKPYIYLHAMKLLEVLPAQTVVIEDSAIGALAGVSAGCFTIAVPNPYTQNHDFSHTHWQLDSFEQITISHFFQTIARLRDSPTESD